MVVPVVAGIVIMHLVAVLVILHECVHVGVIMVYVNWYRMLVV